MVLGPAVRGTTGPRTTCPGGQFFGGTSGPATTEQNAGLASYYKPALTFYMGTHATTRV